MSLTLEGLFGRITRDVPTVHEINELKDDTNRVIREINMKIPGIVDTETPVTQETDNESLTLTFASAGKTINDDGLGNFETMGFVAGQKIWFSGTGAINVTEMTIASIQNDAATNDQITVSETITNDASIVGELVGFTLLSGYSWDNVNTELELKAAVNQLIDIFVDNEALTLKEHDVVYDTENVSEAYYAKLGRSTYRLAASIFGGEDSTIKVKIEEDIAEITTATYVTVIDIPQQYEVLLENGVVYYLLARPIHAGTGTRMESINLDTKNKAGDRYFEALGDLIRAERERDVNSVDYGLEYEYQGYNH